MSCFIVLLCLSCYLYSYMFVNLSGYLVSEKGTPILDKL